MGICGAKMEPKFVVAVGDNFYEDGVASVTDPHWQNSFEKVYTAPSLQVPWWAVLGNHDYHGNCDAQIEYTHSPKRGSPASGGTCPPAITRGRKRSTRKTPSISSTSTPRRWPVWTTAK